jgi:hypothetical protein
MVDQNGGKIYVFLFCWNQAVRVRTGCWPIVLLFLGKLHSVLNSLPRKEQNKNTFTSYHCLVAVEGHLAVRRHLCCAASCGLLLKTQLIANFSAFFTFGRVFWNLNTTLFYVILLQLRVIINHILLYIVHKYCRRTSNLWRRETTRRREKRKKKNN